MTVQREVWKRSERVAFQIVHDIVARGLGDGDHLPREAELVEQYAVSRESIREALRLLEAQGMVSIRRGPRGGPIVGRAESANLARTMTLYFHLAGATYDELLASWVDLAPGNARRAAANDDRREVVRLMTPHLTPIDDDGDRDRYAAHSNGLHHALIALDPNRVLRMLVGAVGDVLRTHVVPTIDPFDLRALIDEDHRAIARAVLDGDGMAAASTMRAHVERLDPIYRTSWPGSPRELVAWK